MADLHWLKIPLTPKAHAGVLAEAKARGILRLVLVALADYLGRAPRMRGNHSRSSCIFRGALVSASSPRRRPKARPSISS